MSLEFTPAENLIFDDKRSTLTLRNSGTLEIIFEIRSSCKRNQYAIIPRKCFLAGASSIKIRILLDKQEEDLDDDLLLCQWMSVLEKPGVSAEDYWKQHKNDQKQKHSFSCVFHMPMTLKENAMIEFRLQSKEEPDHVVSEICYQLHGFQTAVINNDQNLYQITLKMKEIIDEIQASNTRELRSVLADLKLVAQHYRHVKLESVELVMALSFVAKDVRSLAQDLLRGDDKSLTDEKALTLTIQDFGELDGKLKRVTQSYSKISQKLKDLHASTLKAKEVNKARVEKASELQEAASVASILAIPGASLFIFTDLCAESFSRGIEDPMKKVAAEIAGATVGLVAGIIGTVLFPIFGVLAGVLFTLSKTWAHTFKDLSKQIAEVENLIRDSTERLCTISSLFQRLKHHATQCKGNVGVNYVETCFKRLNGSCTDLIVKCDDYLNSLKYSRKNKLFITFEEAS